MKQLYFATIFFVALLVKSSWAKASTYFHSVLDGSTLNEFHLIWNSVDKMNDQAKSAVLDVKLRIKYDTKVSLNL